MVVCCNILDTRLLLGVDLFERQDADQQISSSSNSSRNMISQPLVFLVDGYVYLIASFRLDSSGHLD